MYNLKYCHVNVISIITIIKISLYNNNLINELTYVDNNNENNN